MSSVNVPANDTGQEERLVYKHHDEFHTGAKNDPFLGEDKTYDMVVFNSSSNSVPPQNHGRCRSRSKSTQGPLSILPQPNHGILLVVPYDIVTPRLEHHTSSDEIKGIKRQRQLHQRCVKRQKLTFHNRSTESCPSDTDYRNEPSVKLVDAIGEKTIARILRFLPREDVDHYLQVCKKTWHSKKIWYWRLINLTWRPILGGETTKYYRVSYYRKMHERSFVSSVGWMRQHKTLRKSFFPILCNWLVELHFELFGDSYRKVRCKSSPLNPIHLAVKYLFRFLSLKENITSNRLQLVGVSCYKVAVEHVLGERSTKKLNLTMERYAYYTDNAYTATEVQDMTEEIKASLQSGLEVYTASTATNRLLEHLDAEILTRLFANYIVDLMMHNTSYAEGIPSRIAAAATIVAYQLTKNPCDMKAIELFCHEPLCKIQKTAHQLRKLYFAARTQETGEHEPRVQLLPKLSMIIKHYQSKFIDWIQGKLSVRHRRCLFRAHKKIPSQG